MRKIRFTVDENQRKNLFDLCVAIVVFGIVVLSFAFNKPITPQPLNQQQSN